MKEESSSHVAADRSGYMGCTESLSNKLHQCRHHGPRGATIDTELIF
jgi:hypothetical protein